MAREFSKDELAEYSAQHQHGYESLVRMAPYWRSFMLDEHELAQRQLLEENTRSNATLFRFAAKLTGIEMSRIDSVCETGDFITIVPVFDIREWREHLNDGK